MAVRHRRRRFASLALIGPQVAVGAHDLSHLNPIKLILFIILNSIMKTSTIFRNSVARLHVAQRGRLAGKPLNCLVCRAQKGDDKTKTNGPTDDIKLKAAWYGAEALGNILGAQKGVGAEPTATRSAGAPSTREALIASVREDYDVNYFVTGTGPMKGYDENCVFADPFAQFSGLDRFKRNVSNLGGLMRDIKLDISEFEVVGDEIRTRWKFSSILTFPPWRPRLAAGGRTIHFIDPRSNLIVKHREDWEVEPSKVLGQLFVPASKVPMNKWESFMFAALDKDVKGIWFILSPQVLKYAAATVGFAALWRAATGNAPPPGDALQFVEMATWHVVGVSVVTEIMKFSGGMQGGETGTGGRF